MSATANWISVGDLGQGFATDSNTLPPCHDFSGKSLELLFEDGSSWSANIDLDGNQQIINLPNGLRMAVRVTSLCEGVYFVDYITDNQAVSLVADMVSGRALQLQGKLPAREEASVVLQERAAAGLALTTVSVVFRNARIDGGGMALVFLVLKSCWVNMCVTATALQKFTSIFILTRHSIHGIVSKEWKQA